MNKIETGPTIYKLKRFTSSKHEDFARALEIYLKNTDHNIITHTNEIVYGVDFYNDKFNDADFTAVGLYMNKVLIGYGQFIFFREEKIVFIDYLVIDKQYRKNNTFYEFIEQIKEYFEKMSYRPAFVIGEVSLQGAASEDEYSNKTRNIIRLLKMNNFGVINSTYFQPMLGLENYESNLQAVLMLYPVDEYKSLKKETYLSILKTVYFKHYERWYSMFLKENEYQEYKIHIHSLFAQTNENLKNITSIKLDGYNDIAYNKETYKPTKVPKKILYFLLGFLFMIGLLGCIAYFLKFLIGLEYSDQIYFLVFAAFLYLIVLSIFSEKASGALNKAVEKFIDKLM